MFYYFARYGPEGKVAGTIPHRMTLQAHTGQPYFSIISIKPYYYSFNFIEQLAENSIRDSFLCRRLNPNGFEIENKGTNGTEPSIFNRRARIYMV